MKSEMNKKQVEILEPSLLQGNVNITVIDNGIVRDKINVHNRGTVNICEYLIDALRGDYVIGARPYTIVPCVGSPGSFVEQGTGTPAMGPAKKLEIKDGDQSCSCTLTFFIQSNLSSGIEISGFRLYSKSGSDRILYAEVELGDNTISVSNGTNLKVSWTLIVGLA